MPMKPVRDEFLIAGDLTFHVIQWGSNGRPIMCIHGISANAFCFQALADGLAEDHRVFAYDLRGRGDSDKPEEGYSIPIHAADLAALIDELKLDSPIILGHSLGALIALYFAAHYPQKLGKLVLIDAGAPLPWSSPEGQPAWLTASFSRLGTPISSFAEYKRLLKAVPFLGPYWNDYLDLYFERDVRHTNDGSIVPKSYREGVLEDAFNQVKNSPAEQWPMVTVPTLLLRAGQGLFSNDDQLLPEASARDIQAAIKNCRYVNFPNLNHYTIIFSDDSRLRQEIQDFIGD